MHFSPLSQYIDLWANSAKKLIWRKQWKTVFSGNFHQCEWFKEGELNVTETCIDQHLNSPRAAKPAIIWESERGRKESITFSELRDQVASLAAGLRAIGARKGDRIAIYMPLCPKAIISMLACARIGAVHTVVFAGFSSHSLKDRIDDCECTFVITADGFIRKNHLVELKKVVDEALTLSEKKSIKKVVVLRHENNDISTTPYDIDYDCCVSLGKDFSGDPEIVNSEHPLFILYTSGTTGRPKGIIHSCGGYLTQVRETCEDVFGINDQDIYWCTADIGWITGHSYIVYGPLALGSTLFIYEGALTSPSPDRFYELIDQNRISILYTSPTAIRQFMQRGDKPSKNHSFASLRLLGTVGEPINPEAWHWWHREVGRKACPIVDTWWQTETGAIMITPLPGRVTAKPGSAAFPLKGIDVEVVDINGAPVQTNENGFLVIKHPWPSIARGIYGDSSRFYETYFSQFPGKYFTGDGAKIDEDGYLWILGRVDDVVNVSGHRLGTAEIESALITHKDVAESAVVSRPDPITGEAIVAFICLKVGQNPTPNLRLELQECVASEIGSFARPKEIIFTESLPKTRSGKIMRRVLRELATEGKITGDLSTLEDQSSLGLLSQTLKDKNVTADPI